MPHPSVNLTSHTTIGGIARNVREVLHRLIWPLLVLASLEALFLASTGRPGAGAFALIATSSIAVLAVWSGNGAGLPIIPLLAVQNLVVYGLPIIVGNPTVLRYPPAEMLHAGWEVVACNLAMIAVWRMAMDVLPDGSRFSYALEGLDEATDKVTRVGFAMLGLGTAYHVLRSAGLLDTFLAMLPAGSESIVHVLVSAASACGFFLVGLMIGRRRVGTAGQVAFWVLLATQCLITSAGFLLSACLTILCAALIGLLWGSGRIPWRFLLIALAGLAFLNVGKFTMRDRYWHPLDDDPMPQITLSDMPRYYGEWVTASTDALTGQSTDPFANDDQLDAAPVDATNDENLLTRINNLQNLLFVIDATSVGHIAPLGGATYTLIPPLLIPRVFWPSKPRTHEGQILLNVHFGRQDLHATYDTYIAWGLLPEAYGNFGPYAGAIVLGAVLGALGAWVEKGTARKVLLSLEGFVSFAVFLGVANSYEMVASVLVTSVFQSCVPIVVACLPFVRRTSTAPRLDSASADAT